MEQQRTGSRRSFITWFSCHLVTLSFCLFFLAGCATDNRRGADPLLGGVPSAGSTAAASGAPGPRQPLPAAGRPASTAALASGPSRPPDPRSGLHIGDAPATGPGAAPLQLRRPEPAGQLTGGIPAAPRVTTYEQAEGLLRSRGVKWQLLEMVGDGGEAGEWKFSCSLPSRQNARTSRTYEARAASSLAAVGAVLDQIDRDTAAGF